MPPLAGACAMPPPRLVYHHAASAHLHTHKLVDPAVLWLVQRGWTPCRRSGALTKSGRVCCFWRALFHGISVWVPSCTV